MEPVPSIEEQRRLARNAYNRKWREANPDKVKAATTRWKEANPDKIQAATKRYNDAHREQIRARNIRDNEKRRAEDAKARAAHVPIRSDWEAPLPAWATTGPEG